MTDKKVSELDAIAGSATAADDLFLIVDASGSVTKKITRAELNNAIEQDVLSTVDINGGTIDSTVIGGTTPAAGDFTTLGATGNITVGGTVDGRDVAADGTKLDGIEASATADQTDAEIRAAVEAASDSNVFTDADHTKLNGIATSATANPNAIDNVVEDTSPQLGGDLQSNGNDIVFADNDKAIFGAGSDLQIYHDSANSYIQDTGTGDLIITSGVHRVRTDQFQLNNAANNAALITAANGGAAKLFHNGTNRVETTSSGAFIASKLDVGSVGASGGTAGEIAFGGVGGSIDGFRIRNTEGNYLELSAVSSGNKMVLTNTGNVGIGTTAPTGKLEINGSANALFAMRTTGDTQSQVMGTQYLNNSGAVTTQIFATGDSSSSHVFRIKSIGSIDLIGGDVGVTAAAPDLRVSASGDVSIGTSSALGKLHVHEGARNGGYAINGLRNGLVIEDSQHAGMSICGGAGNGGTASIAFPNGSSNIDGLISYNLDGRYLEFYSGGNERARIDSTGRFAVGKVPDSNFNTGCELDPSGFMIASRADNIAGYFNRNNDGGLVWFGRSSTNVGTISVTSSATTYSTSSDRRLKSNIEDAASASDKIDAIQVRQFDWNADDSHQDYGLIAQELQPIEPLAVTGDADSDEMMGVDYSKLVPMLIKEIQELRGRVAALEAN